MTLMILILLAAVLIVFAIYAVKNASRKAGAVETESHPIVPPKHAGPPPTNQPGAPNAPNQSGSVPDKPGTKGDGNEVLSGGGQG